MPNDSHLEPGLAPKSNPPPLQPRSRTPKMDKTDSKAGPQPVRPAPKPNMPSIAYNETMFGAGGFGGGGREPLPGPRPKELEKEELTTKGRKRKRLAKACSACHKNKRRCDGFAPCSNCEFSARPCIYLNAQGEQIPPPRTRDTSIVPMNKGTSSDGKQFIPSVPVLERRLSGGKPNGAPGASAEDWSGRDFPATSGGEVDWRSTEHPAYGPLEVVEHDPALAAELLDIFLKRTPPYASMLHVPTFLHRQYLGLVSPILMDAIYALAARLCDHPSFVSAFPSSVPSHLRGKPFADRCCANLDRIIEMRHRWTEEDHQMDSGTWEETEFVQSALILSVYFTSTRQPRLGLFYLDVALSVLRPSGPGGLLPPPSARLNLSTHEYFTLAEVRKRTFWLCVMGDILPAASGRPRTIRDHEFANVSLPGPEMYWTRYGGMASNGREPARRDCLAVGTGNWHSEEGQVGEIGHIIRILVLFSNIMAIANNGGAGSHEARHLSPSHYEQALKSWALDLPRHLRFDEVNLSLSMAKIQSPVPEVAFAGWSFAYMHAVAECGMFYLQSKHTGAPFAVQRQGQAVDNLTVIIESFGERGREGPLMFFPVMIVTCWMDHIAATKPAAVHSAMEERVNTWWADVNREWGWERRETLERGIFPNLETIAGAVASNGATAAERERESVRERPFPAARRYDSALPGLGLYQQQTSPVMESSASSTTSHAVVTPNESSHPRYPVLPPLRASSAARSPSPARSARSVHSSRSSNAEREQLPPLHSRVLAERERDWDVEKRPRLSPPLRREWAPSAGPLLGIDALVSAAEEHRRESMEKAAKAVTA